MKTKITSGKSERKKTSQAEILKGIENHKRTASHLEAAAKFHLAAARHHEEGDHAKAAQSTIRAQGHLSMASAAQREDVRHHAIYI